MTGEKKTLLENFISLGALQIVSYVIPLISLPYLSRVLGVEKFGLVFFAFAFMAYFIILTDYGFGLSATREIAVNRHNQNNLSNIFNSVMLIKFVLLLVSFLILSLACWFVSKLRADWIVFQLSFLMVVGNAIYPVWFFQGMERMKYITFLNILSKSIFLVLIFIFVKQESDYIIVPLLNSMGFLVAGIIGLGFAIREFKIKLYVPKWNSLKKQFKYSSEFFLSRVSLSMYSNTNTFCLGLIGSNVMVGYYVAAEKIYQAIAGLQTPLSGAMYPFVAKNKDIKTYKKWFKVAVIMNLFICLFVYIFAKLIISAFYGIDMTEAYKVLRIFCVIALITFPSILLGYPLLGALGHAREANGSVIIGSIIHIIGLIMLYALNKMNIYTIACMVFITESVVLGIRVYSAWKYKLLKESI
ncbi:oligosaccharide flippase family protein [bacterium]|nr:oligosaccharide flippase family protein [bacterium]